MCAMQALMPEDRQEQKGDMCAMQALMPEDRQEQKGDMCAMQALMPEDRQEQKVCIWVGECVATGCLSTTLHTCSPTVPSTGQCM